MMLLPSTTLNPWILVFLIAFICWKGWSKYISVLRCQVERNISISLLSWWAELTSARMCFIQHSCWPLSSPLPKICIWFSDLQPPFWTRRWDSHVIASGVRGLVTCSCNREKLQCKGALESCGTPPRCLWMPCFWAQTSTHSTNHLCLFSLSPLFSSFLPLHTLFGIFSFPTTSCLYFPFLIQYIYICGGECTGSYAWTDCPRAILQHQFRPYFCQTSGQGCFNAINLIVHWRWVLSRWAHRRRKTSETQPKGYISAVEVCSLPDHPSFL